MPCRVLRWVKRPGRGGLQDARKGPCCAPRKGVSMSMNDLTDAASDRPAPDRPASSPEAWRDLASLRTQLLRRQAELLQSLTLHQQGGSRVEHAHDLLAPEGDALDAASDADRLVDLHQTDQTRRELADIGAALQRLAQGRFGRCTDCGQAISPQRLNAQPQALRCLACEARREAAPPGGSAR
jgi:DnaK suppressor protein